MDAHLAGGRPAGESLELGLLHILPQSPLASSGYLPFGSNVVTVGRQQFGDGARSVPRLRPAVRRPIVRTAVSTSGPPAKASCPRPSLGGRDCGMFHGWSPGRLRNSRGLKSHPGRTDFPEFPPIWGRTFPYHGNVAGGQLRQTGSGDETVQPVLTRQPSSAGVSRTGLDSGPGGFRTTRAGWIPGLVDNWGGCS